MATFRNRPVDHVIDVRSRLEFWLGHLPGAINVPLGRLPEGLARHPAIGPDARIVVYCASGARSAAAAATLQAAGYRDVVDGGGLGGARRDFQP